MEWMNAISADTWALMGFLLVLFLPSVIFVTWHASKMSTRLGILEKLPEAFSALSSSLSEKSSSTYDQVHMLRERVAVLEDRSHRARSEG